MTKTGKIILMVIATMMILIFHVWIPVFKYGTFVGNIERFLVAGSYIGVDIFFFVSGYSLSIRPVDNYKEFIINRGIKLLPLFVIAWAFGHFMWFIPSLMLVYLIFPPLYKLCEKRPIPALPLLFVGWAGIVLLVMGVLKPHDDIGIFLFRIPIIIIGAYSAKINVKLMTGLLLLIIGVFLTYRFGYINKLDFPFKGTFYLVGIPVTVGLVFLVSLICSNCNTLTIRPITFLADASLEIYFMQMVLGSVLVSTVFSLTSNKFVTNIIVMAVIILLSILLSKIYPKMVRFFKEL